MMTLSDVQKGMKEWKGGHSEAAYFAWQKRLSIDHADEVLQAMKELARDKGWPVIEAKDLSDVPGVHGKPGKATGVTVTDKHVIGILSGLSVDAKVYTLAHELGHALGDQARIREQKIEELDPITLTLIASGLIPKSRVPWISDSEGEAELCSVLVLEGLGIAPNYNYLKDWKVDSAGLARVYDSAAKAAGMVLDAIHQGVKLKRAA